MNEKKIYQEIPGGKNSFHSAVLTSFSFHFQHFESQVLRSLKQKWITSINLLVDQSMLDEALGVASGNLKTIGQTYSINGISVQGAFHPKLNIFLGDEKILVVFGSGNISPGGHGKNHELFTGFYADSKNQQHLPIILETWTYLKTICKHLEGYSAERITRVLPGACSLIKSFDLPKHKYHNLTKAVDVALLYSDEQSIAKQLLANIPSKEITKITIVCPYYDSDGGTIKMLLSKCPNATIDVYLQNQLGLPPIKMKPSTKIKFYDFDVTHRGRDEITGKNEYVRKLHCKLFHFRSSSIQYCLIGSANATSQGIGGLDFKGANEEFGALYKSKSIDFLKEFGIYGSKKEINISSLKRIPEVPGDKASAEHHVKIRINSIDLNGNYLKVYLSKKYDLSTFNLGAFDLDGEICFKLSVQDHNEQNPGFRLSPDQIGKAPRYCAFLNNKSDIISNKQLINNLHKLINTNPGKESRAIRQIISTIEGGGYNEFEIVDFLNQLNLEKPKEAKRNLASGNTDLEKEDNFDEASTLTYEEAVMKAKDSKEPLKILNVNPTSRLWRSIEQIFENKNMLINEEQMDEEEEGSPNTSRRRITEEKENPKIPLKSDSYAWAQLRSIENMVMSYIDSIKRLKSNEKHNLDIIDYHQFLLVSYILTSVCYFVEYSLPKGISENDWREELDTMYKDLMIAVLKEFALLHLKRSITTHDPADEELVNRQKDAIQKTLYHLFLNLTFILRKKSHPILEDELCLIVFNLFQKLGIPDDRLTNYFENMLKMYQHTTISPNQVRRTKEFFFTAFKSNSKRFINTTLLGYCKIIEHRNRTFKVKSLYNVSLVDENRLKDISS